MVNKSVPTKLVAEIELTDTTSMLANDGVDVPQNLEFLLMPLSLRRDARWLGGEGT